MTNRAGLLGPFDPGAAIFESENFSQSEVAVETVVEAEGVALYHLEGVAFTKPCENVEVTSRPTIAFERTAQLQRRDATTSAFSKVGARTNRVVNSRVILGPPADSNASLSCSLANAAKAPKLVGPVRYAIHMVLAGCCSTIACPREKKF